MVIGIALSACGEQPAIYGAHSYNCCAENTGNLIWHAGQSVDVYHWARELAMRIAMRALLGLDPDDRDSGARAAYTRAATVAVGSGLERLSSHAARDTGGRSTRRSIRSSSGPDSRPRYRSRSLGVQRQRSRAGQPRRQGLAAATS